MVFVVQKLNNNELTSGIAWCDISLCKQPIEIVINLTCFVSHARINGRRKSLFFASSYKTYVRMVYINKLYYTLENQEFINKSSLPCDISIPGRSLSVLKILMDLSAA